jgi:hypothetical protein
MRRLVNLLGFPRIVPKSMVSRKLLSRSFEKSAIRLSHSQFNPVLAIAAMRLDGDGGEEEVGAAAAAG